MAENDSSRKVRVRWAVDDGSAGPSFYLHSSFDAADFEEISEDEQKDLLEDCMQDEFSQRVTYSIREVEGMPEAVE